MRLQAILKEAKQEQNHYQELMIESNIKFWTTLSKNAMLPLSESAHTTSMQELTAMLYETAWKLPEEQQDIFFKQLLENPMLEEGFGDFLKKAGTKIVDGAAAAQEKVDNAKKKVVTSVVDGIKAAGAFASDIYNNYVPDNIKAHISKMGEAAIKMVQNGIKKLGDAASKVLDLTKKIIAKFQKDDPCLATNESIENMHNIILEATSNKYFTGTQAGLLDKFKPTLLELDGKLPEHLAKTVSLLKANGIDVYGRDARNIAYDITINGMGGVSYNEAVQIAEVGLRGSEKNPYFPMSEYFKKNNIISLIKQFDGANDTPSETNNTKCEQIDKESLIETYFGDNSVVGKALSALGMRDTIYAMAKEIKGNPASFMIAVLSAIMTISSGAGALRLAAVIFGSVLPALGTAYVESLKKNGATQEKIAFAEKVVKATRFIATVAQIINIASLAQKGWNSLSAQELDEPKLPAGADQLDDVQNVVQDNIPTTIPHEMSDLSAKSQEILTNWIKDDGNLELSPKTVHNFFNHTTEHMTAEQFAKFDTLVSAAKADPAKYQELIKVLDNPTDNGIINVDMSKVSAVADTTDIVNPHDVVGTDLSSKSIILQDDIRKAAGLSYNDMDSYREAAQADYIRDHFGGKGVFAMGTPLSADEAAQLDALGYRDNPFDEKAQAFLAKFKDRHDDLIRSTYEKIAADKGIKLPADYQLSDPAADAAMDELDWGPIKDKPDNVAGPVKDTLDSGIGFDSSKYASVGIDNELGAELVKDVGNQNAEKLAELVKAGKLSADELKDLLHTGEVSGQTSEQMVKSVDKFITSKEGVAQAASEHDNTTKTTDLDTTLDDKAINIGKQLEKTEIMQKLDPDTQSTVGSKIMMDYKNNPDFAKAWDSPGFDKEGYIKQMAEQNGWFEPLNNDELVKDLKAAGIEDHEMAKTVGGKIQNQFANDPEFRTKWNGMTDDQQKEYLSGLKDKVLEIKETETLVKDIIQTDPKASSLGEGSKKYLDGILRTEPGAAKSWATMDDAAKDLVIKKANTAAEFQGLLLKDNSLAFQNGVEMDGNSVMKFGSAVAEGNYSPDQIEKIQHYVNLGYGDESMRYRKEIASALNSGNKDALKAVIDKMAGV